MGDLERVNPTGSSSTLRKWLSSGRLGRTPKEADSDFEGDGDDDQLVVIDIQSDEDGMKRASTTLTDVVTAEMCCSVRTFQMVLLLSLGVLLVVSLTQYR